MQNEFLKKIFAVFKHIFLSLTVVVLFCFSNALIMADTHYVSKHGGNIPPYVSWETAARVIQKAVDAATDGDTVLVNNGIYRTGETVAPGQIIKNRVMITNSIILKSVNGPKKTRIVGRKKVGKKNIRCVYAGTNAYIIGFTITGGGTIETDDSSYKDDTGAGLFLENCAVVSNCTVINNQTFKNMNFNGGSGAGIFAENSKIISCFIANNFSDYAGGIESYRSYIYNCKIFNNRAVGTYYDWEADSIFRDGSGGGAVVGGSTIEKCIIKGNLAGTSGGGIEVYYGNVINCKIINNKVGVPLLSSLGFGGAGITIYHGIISNSFIYKNSARSPVQEHGGGIQANECNIYNVTVEKNKAVGGKYYGVGGGGIWGSDSVSVYNSIIIKNKTAGLEAQAGGVYSCRLHNCLIVNNKTRGKKSYGGGVINSDVDNSIILSNFAIKNENFDTNSNIKYSCSNPKPHGDGNIDVDPLFINIKKQDYHLQENSPCIDAGINLEWMYGTGIDLDENTRICGNVDIGPYEKQRELDCSFSASITNGAISLKITFSASAAGTNNTGLYYTWDFNNDGITDVEGYDKKNVTYIYNSTGVYSVLLSVKNSMEQTASFLRNDYIHCYLPVKANFAAAPLSGWAPITVSFTNLFKNDLQIIKWDFNNDGKTDSNERNPEFTFITGGVYTVSLFISNYYSDTSVDYDFVSKTNYITVNPTRYHYVSKSGNNIWPYNSWENAATNIQSAINAASNKDYILVTNGTYYIDNKISAYKNVTLKSVNGAQYTIIDANNKCTCLGIGSGATIQGFTIKNGCDTSSTGGGVTMSRSMIADCIIISNTAWKGGGINVDRDSTVLNCIIADNISTVHDGAGIYCDESDVTIQNCTITQNKNINDDYNDNYYAAGITYRYNAKPNIQNCIIFNNYPDDISIDEPAALYNNCIGNWIEDDNGNITNRPEFISNTDFRLLYISPCIDAGTNMPYVFNIKDLDGNNRVFNDIVDMGAYEYNTNFPVFVHPLLREKTYD